MKPLLNRVGVIRKNGPVGLSDKFDCMKRRDFLTNSALIGTAALIPGISTSCSGDKKKIARKLKELYDLSKKYHHGADEGSTLGLSWINPDELELFDSELKEIFDWIDENCVIKMVAA